MGGDQVRVVEGRTLDETAVSVRGLVRRFDDVTALAGVSLDVGRGEFVSLLGPSGCGKTTLLRIIAGLEHQDAGEVWVDGAEVSAQPVHKRPSNLVFQRYALFPHKTVAENVGYSLTIRRTPKKETRERITAMLELVHLPDYGSRRVDELSGGQAQRVALARALIDDPPVLLLDEPLAALDLKLRQAMHIELREIQRRVGSTFMYVTHDQEEALVMSDRVVLMNNGAIVQEGTPRDVYRRPATLFAATFLGEANLFRGPASTEAHSSGAVISEGPLTIAAAGGSLDGATHSWACVRPERISIHPSQNPPGGGENRATGSVSSIVFLGSVVRIGVNVGDREIEVEHRDDDLIQSLQLGTPVEVSWSASDAVLIGEDEPR